jgi:hypothetical protein
VKIDEEKVAELLLLTPVAGLGKDARISRPISNACLFFKALRWKLRRFLFDFDLF